GKPNSSLIKSMFMMCSFFFAKSFMLSAITRFAPSSIICTVKYKLRSIMSGSSWSFLLYPVLIGSLVIVLIALLLNNLDEQRHYPKFWF
ncbi:MAG: HPP family protein, partial [Paenibacillus sp.]|nr:HPP family protein [Paenibacillus sp.]